MENRKDIGKAYKEKLEDYTSSPGNHLWESIEAELNKSKRKVFPLWKTLAGFGMLIILLSTIITYNSISNSRTIELSPITDNIQEANDKVKDNASKGDDDIRNKTNGNQENQIIVSISPEMNSSPIDEKNSNKKKSRNNNSQNTSNNNTKSITQPSYKVNSSNNGKNSYTINKLKKANTISNKTRNNIDSKAKTIDKPNRNSKSTYSKNLSKDQNNLNESIEFSLYPIVIIDELPFAKLDNLFDIEKKKQELEHFKKTYRLSTYLTPAFSNTSSEKSPIDHTLDNAKKTSGFDINYGVALTVSLSKKSSLRIGVGAFSQSILTEDADSIDSNGFLMNSPSFSNINLNSEAANVASEVFSPLEKLDLKQKTEYIETSIDYSFKLLNDKKIALYVNSGISTLFLLKDSILLKDSDGNSLNIGKANNLNKAGLALNLGTSLSYELSKKLNVNFEPIFKYHLGTFKKAHNIKHYSLGIRFGLSFKL